jgi:hypothetical protein
MKMKWPKPFARVTYSDGRKVDVPIETETVNPGRCTAERCTCIGPPRSTLKMFCDHWDASRPAGDHERMAIAMWNTLPDELRKLALDHLRATIIPRHMAALNKWRKQVDNNIAIGSDDVRFHFGAGMAVRNVLRQVVPDHKLPLIVENGMRDGNWDDFYYGAIHELASEPAGGDNETHS